MKIDFVNEPEHYNSSLNKWSFVNAAKLHLRLQEERDNHMSWNFAHKITFRKLSFKR